MEHSFLRRKGLTIFLLYLTLFALTLQCPQSLGRAFLLKTTMAAREQPRGWCGCGDAGSPALSSSWQLLQYSVLKDAALFPSQTIFWTTLNEYYSKYLRTLSFFKIKDVKIFHLRNLQESFFPTNSIPWILRDRTTENNLGRLIFLLWLKPFTTKWKKSSN